MTPEQRQAAYDKGRGTWYVMHPTESRSWTLAQGNQAHDAGLVEVERVATTRALEEFAATWGNPGHVEPWNIRAIARAAEIRGDE